MIQTYNMRGFIIDTQICYLIVSVQKGAPALLSRLKGSLTFCNLLKRKPFLCCLLGIILPLCLMLPQILQLRDFARQACLQCTPFLLCAALAVDFELNLIPFGFGYIKSSRCLYALVFHALQAEKVK